MAAKITTLINKRDNVEIILDEIAAIIALESANQVTLAQENPTVEPDSYKLRVYIERSNPWDEWVHADDCRRVDTSPVVNVGFNTATYDPAKSDPVERQATSATYFIDCYGYGISEENSNGSHSAGDKAAALEAMRAARLVRNILMAGPYTYLGHQGLVSRRWPTSGELYQPQKSERTVDHVAGYRITLQVDFNEFSPQVVGQTIELISAEVTRAADGALLVQTDIPIPQE